MSAPGLALQACFKKAGVKLELLTDIDMLLMIEKGIRGRICQAIHRHAKVNNKYMKNYDKDIASSYLAYLDANSFMDVSKITGKWFQMGSKIKIIKI